MNLDRIDFPGAHAELYVVPWDTEILGVPVAELVSIEFDKISSGLELIEKISLWCEVRDIHLISVRCKQSDMRTAIFLQEHLFRIVELNYLPIYSNLNDFKYSETSYDVELASMKDMETLVEDAGKVFSFGRFHNDPRLGAEIGNRRYAAWMRNSFDHSRQKVEKIVSEGGTVGAFVTEFLDDGTMYWWLTILAENYIGRGVSKNVWQTMMAHAKKLGAKRIRTSTSSHNLIVHNLYVSLGFRFSEPSWSLHWVRRNIPIIEPT